MQTSSGIALQHVAAGEKVIRQGQVSQALYIIVAVLALMFSRDFKGREQEVLSLGNGEFFDEMCLFSGEPSLVTVIASNDLEVMKISATMVHQMIDRQPSFAREIGQILEISRAAIQESSQSPGPSRGGVVSAKRPPGQPASRIKLRKAHSTAETNTSMQAEIIKPRLF